MRREPRSTIEGEWDSYVSEVLRHSLTPDMIAMLKMIFFSGAGAMMSLVARGTSISGLEQELREYLQSRVH